MTRVFRWRLSTQHSSSSLITSAGNIGYRIPSVWRVTLNSVWNVGVYGSITFWEKAETWQKMSTCRPETLWGSSNFGTMVIQQAALFKKKMFYKWLPQLPPLRSMILIRENLSNLYFTWLSLFWNLWWIPKWKVDTKDVPMLNSKGI